MSQPAKNRLTMHFRGQNVGKRYENRCGFWKINEIKNWLQTLGVQDMCKKHKHLQKFN
jgi:hypothetical protein